MPSLILATPSARCFSSSRSAMRSLDGRYGRRIFGSLWPHQPQAYASVTTETINSKKREDFTARTHWAVRIFSRDQRLAHLGSSSLPRLFTVRNFTTTSSSTPKPPPQNSDDNQTDNPTNEPDTTWDLTTKSLGQVIFLNSSHSGTILLASLALGDPYLAFLAGVGTVTANATARNVLQLDAQVYGNGLWAYNGALVGCATAVFVAPLADSANTVAMLSPVLTGLAITTTGAAVSTAVTASLSRTITSMPQWTWAFNVVALSILLRTQPLRPTFDPNSVGATKMVAPSTTSLLELATGPLKGVSQIFVVESAWTGIGILAAIHAYSPLLAGHALLGSTVGMLTGTVCCSDAATAELAAGLFGFNAALTSLGVGVSFRNNTAAWVLSGTGAVATTVLFGALQNVLGALHSPCLTLPFCITMSACYQLGGRVGGPEGVVPSLELATNPHSPEQNQ